MVKTESELLFEEYLTSNGYTDWVFEPDIPGQTRRPDYLVRWQGAEFLFEVKEMHRKGPVPKIATVDPYKGLREKINAARKKFKELRQWCCSLVVCNIDDWRTNLGDPREMFGAMLGNYGYTMPFDTQKGLETGAAQPAFLGGGKMLSPKTGQPWNKTIAAIVALERLLTKGGLRIPRVKVYENPDARIPLPRDLFKRPYDERMVFEEGLMQRVFVGDALRRQEEAEGRS